MRAADSKLLTCGKRRGNDGAARMRAAGGEIVVGFVGMRQLAIGERGFDWSAENLGGNDGGNFLAAVGPCELDCQATRGEFRA